MSRLTIVVLCFTVASCRPGPEGTTTPKPAGNPTHISAAVPVAARSPLLRPCTALDSLETGKSDPSPLPPRFCAVAPVEANDCPAASDIAVIIDRDTETARARVWDGFVLELASLSASCQTDVNPLDGRLPGRCGTIQALGGDPNAPLSVGSCQVGGHVFPGAVRLSPNADRTPAMQAVAVLCDRVRDGRLGVGVMAYDGVPDANYNDATPSRAFGDRVGQCAADGLVIQVVAAPQTYRYVYFFASPRFGDYAKSMAAALASRWSAGAGGVKHLDLAGSIVDRNQLAAAALRRAPRPLPGWDNDLPPIISILMHGRDVGHRVDLLQWSLGDESHASAFDLSWRDDGWKTAAGIATVLKPPLLYVNQDLAVSRAGVPVGAEADARTERLGNCKTGRDLAAMMAPSTCGPVSPYFFQRLHVTRNKAEIEIYKGPQPERIAPAGEANGLRATAQLPLLAAALVSPRLEVDSCLRGVGIALRSVHLWSRSLSTSTKTDPLLAAGAVCDAASPLHDLVAAFGKTAPSAFHSASGTFASTADRRVGMESLVTAMRAIGDARVRSDEGADCVITTFRFTLDSCDPPTVVRLPDPPEQSDLRP